MLSTFMASIKNSAIDSSNIRAMIIFMITDPMSQCNRSYHTLMLALIGISNAYVLKLSFEILGSKSTGLIHGDVLVWFFIKICQLLHPLGRISNLILASYKAMLNFID